MEEKYQRKNLGIWRKKQGTVGKWEGKGTKLAFYISSAY